MPEDMEPGVGIDTVTALTVTHQEPDHVQFMVLTAPTSWLARYWVPPQIPEVGVRYCFRCTSVTEEDGTCRVVLQLQKLDA